MKMYSPKIREDLIPILYHIGKEEKKPMTKVVDEILREYVADQYRLNDGGSFHIIGKFKTG